MQYGYARTFCPGKRISTLRTGISHYETGEIPKMKYDTYRVQAVERALQILKMFSIERPEVNLREISEALGVHKSTAHRIAMTLEEAGFLRRDSRGVAYTLGLKVLELGTMVLHGLELRRQARPHLEWMNLETGETVHLGVLDSGEVVYIDKIEGGRGIRLFSDVGKRAPVHCTGLGKVLLSNLPNAAVRKIIAEKGMKRFTADTVVSLAELLRNLDEVRQKGYSVDQGEHERLVHCVAAPIRDYTGKVVAAVSVTTIASKLEEAVLKKHIALATEAGARISSDMGYGASVVNVP